MGQAKNNTFYNKSYENWKRWRDYFFSGWGYCLYTFYLSPPNLLNSIAIYLHQHTSKVFKMKNHQKEANRTGYIWPFIKFNIQFPFGLKRILMHVLKNIAILRSEDIFLKRNESTNTNIYLKPTMNSLQMIAQIFHPSVYSLTSSV